jgi:hypothetical protein
MAISRMNMERQMRNMGGIMTLDDPRQGYFLGKLVKKITKPIKKIVKSPIGKAALLGAAAYGLGGAKFLGGKGMFTGGQGLSRFSNLLSPFTSTGKLSTLGDLFRVGGEAGKAISVPRVLAGLGIGSAIAAPFLMGDDTPEEVDEGVDVTGIQPMVANIRQQARDYYQDPTKSALYFMPPKSAVQSSFYAAEGGLADIPREGYENGGGIMMASNMENDRTLENLLEKYLDMGLSPAEAEKAAREEFERMTKQLSADRTAAAEGGLMDLGGMEKDYREGGFVPIGAKERADDVPARLSKNEFVFTADAVRNAGGGDIDKGAEVMQNMMDNLEAGGTISEESQGMENPAQAMFDQAQMLEGRLA